MTSAHHSPRALKWRGGVASYLDFGVNEVVAELCAGCRANGVCGCSLRGMLHSDELGGWHFLLIQAKEKILREEDSLLKE